MEGLNWRAELVDRMAKRPLCGYAAMDIVATEPSALTALALAGEGRFDGCDRVAKWLEQVQSVDGSVGVRENEQVPCWPTSLAVMVWSALRGTHHDHYAGPLALATQWILNARAVKLPREPGLGHDPSLEAWPWVEGTHAWVEPTALHVLALKTAGFHDHSRTREAARMLADRQLPQGGFNYGNTYVMDRLTHPHLQPTGLAILALADEVERGANVEKSLSYLAANISDQTGTASLCWSLVALAAHGQTPPQAENWLETVYQRTLLRDKSPLKFALILLAIQGEQSLLVKHHRRAASHAVTRCDTKAATLDSDSNLAST